MLESMSLDEKLGQLICLTTREWENAAGLAAEGLIGSLYGCQASRFGKAEEVAELINHLQGEARQPLLFVGEQEHGSYLNFPGGTRFPAYMATGATRSADLAYQFGAVNAREALAVGYNWVSCPTVDVNINPDNPIINTRSLGEDPELVSQLGGETCRAIVEQHGLTCVCHFPGHGATECDSHARLPVVDRSAEEMRAVELAPYLHAIPHGWMNCIMTAHIHYPAYDTEPGLPATLSRNVLTGLLRGKLGYKGLIATDGMGMKAIADNYPGGEAAVRAVEAGCDILLVADAEGTRKALRQAVTSGRLAEGIVDAAAERVLRAKHWMGLYARRTVEVERVSEIVGCSEHRSVAKRIARESVTLLRGHGLPLRRNGRVLVACWGECDAAMEVSRRRAGVTAMQLVEAPPEHLLAALKQADHVIVAVETSVRAYQEDALKPPPQLVQLVSAMLSTGKHVSLLILGNPYLAAQLPATNVCVCTYDNCPDSVEAGVMALYGELKPQGKLPVSMDGFPYGFGL